MSMKNLALTAAFVLLAAALVAGQTTKPAPAAQAPVEDAKVLYQSPAVLWFVRSKDMEEWPIGLVEGFLKNRRVCRKVYNEMRMFDWDAFKNAPDGVDPISVVQSWISVRSLASTPGGTMVAVRSTLKDPNLSVTFVNRVIDALKDVLEEQRTMRVDRETRVLAERAQDIERKIAESQRALTLYQQDHPSLVVDDAASVRARYQQILADIEQYKRRGEAAAILLAKLETVKAAPGVAVEIAHAQAEQETAQKALADLETRRAAELEAAKAFVQDSVRRDELVKQIDSLAAMRDELARELERVKTEFERDAAMVTVLQTAEPPIAAPGK